jgi:homogentisate 1,2-dioxygenase
MFESRYRFIATGFALGSSALDPSYAACWQGLKDRFDRFDRSERKR